MSDRRNLDERPEPGTISEPIRPEDTNTHQGFYDNGGLSNFHRAELPERTSRTARLTGFAVVVLVVIGAAVYGYMSGGGPPAPNNFFAHPTADKSAANTQVQTAPAPANGQASQPAPAQPDQQASAGSSGQPQ